MSGESSVSGSGGNHNVVPYDYSDKKADSAKVPKFNGDLEEFSLWKTNFNGYIMRLDGVYVHQTKYTKELLKKFKL